MAIMREDIALAAECAVDGVVLGLLTASGDVDVDRTRELVDLARPMEVTFHRAIDMSHDLESALEDVIRTGADRVLTSGGEQTAMQGRRRIRRLVQAAEGRIRVMAGGGVRPENVLELIQETAAAEFHSALRTMTPSPVEQQVRSIHLGDPGIDEYTRSVVRAEDVRSLRQAMDAAFSRDSSGS
jgi:copper homeostasis protein